MSLLLALADDVVREARRKAEELGVAMTIAVVDKGGHLLALARMDNAKLASLDIAIGKAYTAVALEADTAGVAALVQPGEPLYGMDYIHQPRPLVPFGGGVPLYVDGRVVGGVGASGGSVDQDSDVARTAQAAAGLTG